MCNRGKIAYLILSALNPQWYCILSEFDDVKGISDTDQWKTLLTHFSKPIRPVLSMLTDV